MSYVTISPELLAAAAGQLQGIGLTVSAANAAVALPTTGVVPAAIDEVSAMTAARFAEYGRAYQMIATQAGVIHEEFLRTMHASADAYAATEAENARQAVGGQLASAAAYGARGGYRGSAGGYRNGGYGGYRGGYGGTRGGYATTSAPSAAPSGQVAVTREIPARQVPIIPQAPVRQAGGELRTSAASPVRHAATPAPLQQPVGQVFAQAAPAHEAPAAAHPAAPAHEAPAAAHPAPAAHEKAAALAQQKPAVPAYKDAPAPALKALSHKALVSQ
jgi:PE family